MSLAKSIPGGNANVAVTSLVVMMPVTRSVSPFFVRVKVVPVTVAGLTGLLKVAVSAEEVDTLVAPSAGVVALSCSLLLNRAAVSTLSAVPVPVPEGLSPHPRRFDPRKMTNTK